MNGDRGYFIQDLRSRIPSKNLGPECFINS